MPQIAWLVLATVLLVPSLAAARDPVMPTDPLQVVAMGTEPETLERSATAIHLADLPRPTFPDSRDEVGKGPPTLPPVSRQGSADQQTAFSTFSDSELDGLGSITRSLSKHGLMVGTNVSTLGIGAEIGYRLNDYLGLRMVGNYYADELALDYEGVEYEADITLFSAGALVDFYPFEKIFRITGGIHYNGNGADLYLPARDMNFNGQHVPAEQIGPLEGSVEFRSYAPYLGFGLQGSFFDGSLVIGADLGVFFQGSPDVQLSGNGQVSNDPRFQSEVDREIDKIEGDTQILGTYPVISFSLTYRF